MGLHYSRETEGVLGQPCSEAERTGDLSGPEIEKYVNADGELLKYMYVFHVCSGSRFGRGIREISRSGQLGSLEMATSIGMLVVGGLGP